ncbi:MAG: DNA repair protein RadC [Alistipes sp.]|nr:DNA repair protein RadC [Alistipes senegalensis]MCM1249696.1 DNA repair protein RadC [Alistipes sp.]
MKNIQDKLASRGAESLSDRELLALLVEDPGLADTLLEMTGGSLVRLAAEELPRLRMMGGLGLRRARVLAAAAEFGRRVAASQAQTLDSMSGTEDVLRFFRPQLEKLDHEECWVVYLSSSNRILEHRRISQGGVRGTIVDHRLIIKRALELLAMRLILIHNHPSGNAGPSQDDRTLTERVSKAAALFDIRLVDHVIISREGHFSFYSSGLLKE